MTKPIKTTDLKVGHKYRLRSGLVCTIEEIYGRGRNRKVITDQARAAKRYHYPGIKAFAYLVEQDLGPAQPSNLKLD